MSELCDIAIVGMAGLFSKAPNKERFWNNVLGKVDAISDAPESWLGTSLMLDLDADPGKMRIYTKRGGFLGDLSRFDPKPFGTMPVSVVGGEPDQFLALAAAKDALDDAGYGEGMRSFDSSRAGVILGHAIHANRANVNGIQQALVVDQFMALVGSLFPEADASRLGEVERLLRSKVPRLSVDAVPGLVPNMMTGRICNRLNLMGPNYIMDAACASSLMAVEAAARELRAGRADLMLAGGVNTTSSTPVYALFCQLGALSRKGSIRPFSSQCDGTLLGEGLGIFALKRVEDALAADDRIYAVIKGIGTSSDGRSSGLMAPRLEGEVLAIKRAYEQAGFEPNTIDLIEAHGTGIPLGDQTEIAALRTIFGDRTKSYPHVAIGSVKSMIGHCIPAAGAAAIIKVAMALNERILPPTLCDEVSGDLGIENTRFYVNTEVRPWIRGNGPRRAGINAFGFGGINSHMILEESPARAVVPDAAFGIRRLSMPELCVFGAADPAELLRLLQAAQQKAATAQSLTALAGDFAACSGSGPLRLAIVAESVEDLRTKLFEAAEKLVGRDSTPFQTRNGIYYRPGPFEGRVAFMFPGENSQYTNMHRSLALASPSFRSWFDRLDGMFGDREFPHRDFLYPPSAGLSEAARQQLEAELGRVDAGSEAVFFSDIGYLKLLTTLLVKPDFIVGHSTGENAAIVASGIVELDDEGVCRYIKDMNRIFSDLDAGGIIPSGVLLTVGAASASDIQDVVDRFDGLLFTMDNCPNQAVLFSPEDIAQDVQAMLGAKGAICMRLPLSWAYHTHYVQPMADRFKTLFTEIPFRKSAATLYSCVTARPYPSDPQEMLQTAAAQYVNRVRFSEVIRNMHADGARIFIEVGPGNNLSGFVRDILKDEEYLALSCDNPRRDSVFAFLALLGQLFVTHVFNDVEKLNFCRAEGTAVAPSARLPSELPLIYLDKEETMRARTLLAGAAGAGVAPAPVFPPDMSLRTTSNGGAPPAGPGTPTDPMTSCAATPSPGLAWYDWTGRVGPPELALHAVFLRQWIRDARELEGWAHRFLTPSELEMWRDKFARSVSLRRQEWLLGRIAAKHVVAGASGETLDEAATITIAYDDRGKPIALRADGRSAPCISISHKDGFAVAAAAAFPVGVDIELIDRVRESSVLADRILGAGELELVRRYPKSDELTTTLWSIKEASAKAIGAPFLGHEREIEITRLDFEANRAAVQIAGTEIEAFFRRTSRYVCALARTRSVLETRISGAERKTANSTPSHRSFE